MHFFLDFSPQSGKVLLNQMTESFHFVAVSSNKKTGPIAVSMSQSNTCPDACIFKSGPCYAKSGNVRIHWNRLDRGDSGSSWSDFIKKLKSLHRGAMFRHNVAGDLPGENNKIDSARLEELTEALKNKVAWTYSHKPVLDSQSPDAESNRAAIAHANKNGFTVNLSGNNIAHADKLKALNIGPVVTVLPSTQVDKTITTPAGNKVIVCPATYKDNVSCATCGLCQVSKRSVIIGFPAHGVSFKKVDKLTNGAAIAA
jgi:hypothetical protein